MYRIEHSYDPMNRLVVRGQDWEEKHVYVIRFAFDRGELAEEKRQDKEAGDMSNNLAYTGQI